MIILVPMGGKGLRFADAGYTTSKPCIPTTDRHTGMKLPMIICAMKDIPDILDSKNKIICIDRDFHEENGTEEIIRQFFPNTTFIHDHVLLDQAYGCFLAREFLQTNEELFIGACDNGIIYDKSEFDKARKEADVLMISHSNDENIACNPYAHSWAKIKPYSKELEGISIKEPISNNPMNDYATTGMFWFKHASIFLEHLENMIWSKDTLDGKYYVDKVLQYCINAGLKVQYFNVSKYICWGTPEDYGNYEKTINYWKQFIKEEEVQ
jgi:dTDP-glucose pyrophosphorylase